MNKSCIRVLRYFYPVYGGEGKNKKLSRPIKATIFAIYIVFAVGIRLIFINELEIAVRNMVYLQDSVKIFMLTYYNKKIGPESDKNNLHNRQIMKITLSLL